MMERSAERSRICKYIGVPALSAVLAACSSVTEQPTVVGPEAIAAVDACTVPGLPDVGRIRISADVTFFQTERELLQLDAAWREDLRGLRRGAVIFVHGGAWREGSRRDYALEMLQAADRGYLAASIDYRLTPSVQFPLPVRDAQCAIRYIKALAGELGFDSTRVVLVGASAGVQVSILAAHRPGETQTGCVAVNASSHVNAIAALSGVFDVRARSIPTGDLLQAVTAYLGGPPATLTDVAANASPIAVANSSTLPTLLLHGTSDEAIPVSLARAYRSALAAIGKSSTLIEIPGANHYFTPFDSTTRFQRSTCTLLAFIDKFAGIP